MEKEKPKEDDSGLVRCPPVPNRHVRPKAKCGKLRECKECPKNK